MADLSRTVAGFRCCSGDKIRFLDFAGRANLGSTTNTVEERVMRRNHDIFNREFLPYNANLIHMDYYREHRVGRELLVLLGFATTLAIALTVLYVGI